MSKPTILHHYYHDNDNVSGKTALGNVDLWQKYETCPALQEVADWEDLIWHIAHSKLDTWLKYFFKQKHCVHRILFHLLY